MDFQRQFCHHNGVAGLGEDRRVYHRRAVADTIRRLRKEKGWNQEELADRLHTDRRQVARLEAAQVPVTLELIEALGIVFQTFSVFFMTSLAGSGPVDMDAIQGLASRIAVDEMRRRFGASLDRSAIETIVRNAEMLDDEQLWVLLIVADALVKASFLEDQDEGNEWPRLLELASRKATKRKGTRIGKGGE